MPLFHMNCLLRKTSLVGASLSAVWPHLAALVVLCAFVRRLGILGGLEQHGEDEGVVAGDDSWRIRERGGIRVRRIHRGYFALPRASASAKCRALLWPSWRDLLAATEAVGDDDRLGTGGLDGGEQTVVGDGSGDFELVGLEAEGSGHAAAAGLDGLDLGSGAGAGGRSRSPGRRRPLCDGSGRGGECARP